MHIYRSCSTVMTLFTVLAMGALGCSTSDSPPLGTVVGTVTLDNQPLQRGTIYFIPKSGGRTSTATIDENGNYKLLYSLDEWGAKVDDHTVKISTESEFGGGERIPERYNVKSELEVKVQSGANEHNFALVGELKKGKKK